jgi:hypothetical protein
MRTPLIIAILFLFSCSSYSNDPHIMGDTIPTSQLESLFERSSSEMKYKIKIVKAAGSQYDIKSQRDTNQNDLEVRFIDGTKTNIELSTSAGKYIYGGRIGDSIIVAESLEHWFICWINEPFYSNIIAQDLNPNRRYEFHVRLLNKSNSKVVLDTILNQAQCCFLNLDVCYCPSSKAFYYAYNFHGEYGRMSVIFGGVSEDGEVLKTQKVSSEQFDYRMPLFIKSTRRCYLSHTTGDSWGFNGVHVGKQAVSLYEINSSGQLLLYKVIDDVLPVDEKLSIKGDTLFYRLVTNSQKFIYKRKGLSNLD